ncbi:MAG: MFS transporter [Legionellaceae bacterium]|nr:MFS transporter [Legionellaceae bacterium]
MEKHSRNQLILGSIICLVGALFYCYEFILRIVPGILQDELTSSFGNISASTFGELSALYYFAYSPMQLPVGVLMDRYGARKLLTLACLCCTLGSLMFSYSTSISIAGAGRFLVGFGSSFAFVGVLSSAIKWLPQKYFSLVAGLMTTIGMLGLVYGEIKLTSLAKTLSLSSILMMLVSVGAFLTILIFFVVRDNPNNNKPTNVPLFKFLRNVIEILKAKEVWLIGIIAASLYTSLSVFGELWGKSYLENAHHLTNSEAAETIAMMFIGWGVGAPISGYLSDKFNNRLAPLMLGTLLSLLCICYVLYQPGISHSNLNVLMFLYGIFSSTEIIAFILAKESVDKILPGTIFAVINMIVTLGGAIFQPLVGKLLDLYSNGEKLNGIHVYKIQDYQRALSIIPICLIITLLALLVFGRNLSNKSTKKQ